MPPSTEVPAVSLPSYDANGNYQWTVALGLTPPSYSGIEVRDIQTAGSSVYVIGTMYNTSGVNFNPLGAADFKSANNNNNTFFASYSASSGTRNWVGQLPTGSSNLFNSLALCLNGGYLYLTGHTVNSGNFNPITFSGRQISISGGSTFVGKYDLDGKADDLSNNYVVGASGVSGDPYGIAVKGSNVYITGYQGNQNNQSYYLAKYNGSSWISRLIQGAGTGSTYNSGLDVAVDNNTPETAYLVGQFLGTNVNFGGIQVTSGDNGQNSDGFVAHYDANLICQRVSNISVTSRFGYFGFSGATSGIDLSGNDIAVAGSFGSQISYDKCSATDNLPSGSINSNGSNTDGYIGRYNPNAFPNSAGISIQGPTQVCPNRNVNYFVNTIPGIVNYQWEAPSGWTVVGGQGTSNVTFRTPNSGSLSGPVRLRVSNGCEFSASPITLFVSPSFSCGSSFAMAPNPADNIITISPADAIGSVQAAQTLKTAEPMRNDKPVQYIDFEVVIYDRLGQAILTAKNPENNTPLSINIGSLRPGIYIVQIISSFGKETKQLQILR